MIFIEVQCIQRIHRHNDIADNVQGVTFTVDILVQFSLKTKIRNLRILPQESIFERKNEFQKCPEIRFVNQIIILYYYSLVISPTWVHN